MYMCVSIHTYVYIESVQFVHFEYVRGIEYQSYLSNVVNDNFGKNYGRQKKNGWGWVSMARTMAVTAQLPCPVHLHSDLVLRSAAEPQP